MLILLNSGKIVTNKTINPNCNHNRVTDLQNWKKKKHTM